MNHPIFMAVLILGTLGCLLLLVGMATPAWATMLDYNMGLFVLCRNGVCASLSLGGASDAVKAFIVIAFLSSLAGAITAFVYQFRFLQKEQSNRILCLVIGILFLVGGILGLIASIIFATKVGSSWKLEYSFGLAIVGSLFCVVAGALGFVQRSKSS